MPLLFESSNGENQDWALGEKRMSRTPTIPTLVKRPSALASMVEAERSTKSEVGPNLLKELVISPEPTYSFAFYKNIAFAGGFTGTIYQYDMKHKQHITCFSGHCDVVRQLKVVPSQENSEGPLLYSVSKDRTCRVWEVCLHGLGSIAFCGIAVFLPPGSRVVGSAGAQFVLL